MNFTRNRIVVVGGGFCGHFTALNLAVEGEVTRVSWSDHFLFTPLHYEYLSGEVEAWYIAPDYRVSSPSVNAPDRDMGDIYAGSALEPVYETYSGFRLNEEAE